MRFSAQVAVVTGGGSGIGRVTAGMLAAEGAAVAVVDRRGQAAEAAAAELVSAGHRAEALTADVSVAAEVEAMADAALRTFGRVDVLVNNAAVAVGGDLLDTDEATWDGDVAVTLKGAYLCSRALLPAMIRQGGGALVNVASVNGLSALGNAAYSAAKAGLVNLTQSVAVRYGRDGVRANAVAPGTIRTPIWGERLRRDPQLMQRLVKWYPLGRVGEPEDVARAVLFLASAEAAWITGAVLRVDGGLLAGNDAMTRELLADDPPASSDDSGG